MRLEDGRCLRLAGIQAPQPARGGVAAWPLAEAAAAALAELAVGREVELRYGGAPSERHGCAVAQLWQGARWIQGALLAAGWARVESLPDNRAAVAPMLAREAAARAARRGLWADPFYAVRSPEALEGLAGSFQIVEGRIAGGTRRAGAIYLNFGADWRRAFTLRFDGAARRLSRAAGLDPLRLVDRRVRVRGWLRAERGRTLLEISHPEQIELLAEP